MASIYSSTNKGWRLRLDWSITGQSIADNKSTLSLDLWVYDGTGYSQNESSGEAYYILQGEKRWNPYNYSSTGWYKLGSKTITVSHNADGTKSIALTAEWDCGFDSSYTPRHLSLSETVTERASSNGLNERDYSIMLQAMQTIHRRSKGLLDFVENYRKLTRIPVPMQQLFPVSSLFDDLRGLYPAGAISFSFSVRPVDLRIYADRAMIEQVLINLLKNAVEACQERSYPEVRVNAFRREGVPVITVSDNGYGIVPEAMDKIFVPFFTTKQGGSGIGLSVCRQIMNRHGGSISVISEEEKGTTFTLQFPQTRVL